MHLYVYAASQLALASLLAVAVASPVEVYNSILDVPALSEASVHARDGPQTSFVESCTNIAYFGYCRIETNCTVDGRPVRGITDGHHDVLQHSFLDLGRCVAYNAHVQALQWRTTSVAHWQSAYCEPCSSCTIDVVTAVMTCQCRYADTADDHVTHIDLNQHVFNKDGVLSCLDVAGDPDDYAA